MTRVMVFGAFDGLHEGHRHLLDEARQFGEELIVCLATDATIERLKGHAPKFSFDERKKSLEQTGVTKVVVGDDSEGTYSAILSQKPDVIAFGYDQQALHDNCVAWLDEHAIPAHTVFLSPFKPEIYKSSLLNK